MGYLSNIKKQYWIALFNSLIPAYVIERLFWQERGMSVQMVVYAEIIYALTVTLCEIPSGILADRFGRKRLLIVNAALSAVELLILLFASGFTHFAVAVFLAGIGKALASGSENALLYDSLAYEGRQGDFEKLLGRLTAVDFGGSVIAAVSGSLLAAFFNFELNYKLSVLSMLTAFAITLSLKEPPMLTMHENGKAGVKQQTKRAVSVFKSQPLVFVYSLTGAVLGACLIYLDEFWQIITESAGIPVIFFGAVSALGLTLRIPGNLLAYKLKGRFTYKRILACVICLSMTCYGAVFFTRDWTCLIPVMLLFLISGVVDPLITGYLHHHNESDVRATVESFASLGMRAISIGVGLLFGYVSRKMTIFAGFIVPAAVCFAYLAVFGIGGVKK